MFIEPGLTIYTGKETKRVYPDIAICNTKEVIELKYQPRAKPKYKKDISNLDLLSKHRESLVLSNRGFRGEVADVKVYPFSSNMLFVWAGIHGKIGPQVRAKFSKGFVHLKKGYVELHAETSHEGPPTIYVW